jgi:hypothetical protein
LVTSAEAQLALSAALQRVARWSGAEMVAQPNGTAEPVMVPTAGAALSVARQLELAARAEAIAAIRQLRGDGRSWQVIASLLGFDSLTDGGVANPALLAFDYAAGLPRPPQFAAPQFVWLCSECKETISDEGPEGSATQSQRGHRNGCNLLAAEIAKWNEHPARRRADGT